MSFAVVHMKKIKSAGLRGMQFHHQRERDSNTNPDIDSSKTYLNYDLVNRGDIDFNKKINKVIKDNVKSDRAIRFDAVRLCDFIITSDKKFFENMDSENKKVFFEKSLDFFKEKYGEEKVMYGKVHLDERTPHMHLGLVPINEDGKLTAKNMFNKIGLRKLQDEYPEFMKENGFNLERGVKRDKPKKHIETQTFKDREEKRLKDLEEKNKEIELKIASRKEKLEEVNDLDFKIESKKTVLNNLNQGNDCLDEDIKYKLDGFDVKMNYFDFRKFLTQIESIKKVKKENEDLKNENSIVHKKCSDLRKSQEEVSSRFTNWIDDTYKHMSLESREQFKRRGSESLANGSTGNYDEDSTLDSAVMDSKAFNEDVYIKCTNEKQNSLKEPTMGYNKFEMDWD